MLASRTKPVPHLARGWLRGFPTLLWRPCLACPRSIISSVLRSPSSCPFITQGGNMALRENSAGPSSCQGKTDSLQSAQALLEASRPPGHLLQESRLASSPTSSSHRPLLCSAPWGSISWQGSQGTADPVASWRARLIIENTRIPRCPTFRVT